MTLAPHRSNSAKQGEPIPEGWEKSPLGDHLVGKPKNGYSAREVDHHTGTSVLGLGCLTPDGFKPNHLKQVLPSARSTAALLHDGDLLISRSNTRELVGLAGVFKDTGSPTTYPDLMMRLTPAGTTSGRYLEALLRSPELRRQIQAMATGTSGSMVKISSSIVQSLEVVVPPLPEQTRITEVLDTLDEAIRGTQTQIEKNSLIYQGLQERFFAPHAIQTREGWEEARLEDIAESITSGPRGWACYYAEEGDHFLRIGNLTRKHLDLRFDDVVKVQPPAGAEGVRTALAPGDLLISITADLGIIGVVPDWMGVAYINQHIARARLIRSKANPRFVGYQLAGQLGQKQFNRLNDVGAKAGLNLPTVGRLKVWLPSLPVQKQIATALDTVQQSLRQDVTLLSKLTGLKSGLTSDLLTGRIRVPVGASAC